MYNANDALIVQAPFAIKEVPRNEIEILCSARTFAFRIIAERTA